MSARYSPTFSRWSTRMPRTSTARITADPVRTGRSIRRANDAARERTTHPDRDRGQHDREHLGDLAERQRDVVAAIEVIDRQPRHHGQREQRDHRVDRGEGDVQRDIAVEQVAEQVGTRPAGRGREQQQADTQQRREVQQDDDPEADGRQQDQLTGERDRDRARVPTDSPEVVDREAEPEPNMMMASAIGRPTLVSTESMIGL
jgi:hypothetical protein